ncbi:acetolactate synthase large subunit [Candidatus Micrarchaeota archaeon]|nr:acetolactate synthase large subunit [Candidatus Micrarchaeota archaeon]
MKASDLMVKCLENEGVEYIFGLPGEENLEVMESLSSSNKIKFITARQEQGAAFMADVYGRIKYKPGVCLATLGPGALNLATGVASANLDHSPLVAITGQADFKEMHKEQHQFIDIVRAFKPITKWNTRISSADSVPEVVRKAFRISTSEKFGATHIEIANDIAKAQTEAKPLKVVDVPEQYANEIDIRKAAELINNSKNPIIICGNSVERTRCADEFIGFVEKTNLPVAKTFMSKGTISGIHPLSLGTLGTKEDYIVEEVRKADLIITIGYDLVEYSPEYWNKDRNKKIICIDTVPEEFVDSYYQFDIELIGSIAHNLQLLAGLIDRRNTDLEAIKKLRAHFNKERESFTPSVPFKPQQILVAMRKAMKEEDILVSDVGSHKIWISRLFPTYKPNTVVISNGLASMGIAIPGAIGAKLAKPEKTVFSANGDGGFMMNAQEIETAKRVNAPFVGVIFNDSGYGMIEWSQKKVGKKVFGVKFGNPDFVKFAESFGVKGYRVERMSELEETLSLAAKSGEVAIVDVPVDYSENARAGKNI